MLTEIDFRGRTEIRTGMRIYDTLSPISVRSFRARELDVAVKRGRILFCLLLFARRRIWRAVNRIATVNVSGCDFYKNGLLLRHCKIFVIGADVL